MINSNNLTLILITLSIYFIEIKSSPLIIKGCYDTRFNETLERYINRYNCGEFKNSGLDIMGSLYSRNVTNVFTSESCSASGNKLARLKKLSIGCYHTNQIFPRCEKNYQYGACLNKYHCKDLGGETHSSHHGAIGCKEYGSIVKCCTDIGLTDIEVFPTIGESEVDFNEIRDDTISSAERISNIISDNTLQTVRRIHAEEKTKIDDLREIINKYPINDNFKFGYPTTIKQRILVEDLEVVKIIARKLPNSCLYHEGEPQACAVDVKSNSVNPINWYDLASKELMKEIQKLASNGPDKLDYSIMGPLVKIADPEWSGVGVKSWTYIESRGYSEKNGIYFYFISFGVGDIMPVYTGKAVRKDCNGLKSRYQEHFEKIVKLKKFGFCVFYSAYYTTQAPIKDHAIDAENIGIKYFKNRVMTLMNTQEEVNTNEHNDPFRCSILPPPIGIIDTPCTHNIEILSSLAYAELLSEMIKMIEKLGEAFEKMVENIKIKKIFEDLQRVMNKIPEINVHDTINYHLVKRYKGQFNTNELLIPLMILLPIVGAEITFTTSFFVLVTSG